MFPRRSLDPRPLFRRFRSDRKGATAVEFALVAAPFFLLLMAIMELALVFLIDAMLENATIQTGRLIRTGQADAQAFDAARFKAELCERMSIFADSCAERATVRVQVIAGFNSLPTEPTTATQLQDCYNGGQPGNFVLVRAWYRQPVITFVLDQAVAHTGGADKATLLRATTAFRNEPFTATQPAGGTC